MTANKYPKVARYWNRHPIQRYLFAILAIAVITCFVPATILMDFLYRSLLLFRDIWVEQWREHFKDVHTIWRGDE